MSERQKFLDRVRELKKDLELELQKGKFVKEVERFQIQEAIFNLNIAEKHLNGFLQVDKHNGN